MPFYVVHFFHPNEEGWLAHLQPHVNYLRERVADGALVASGPLIGTPVRAGFLIIKADDRQAVQTVIEADPYWREGLVENMTVVEWDPLFGVFNAVSSRPGFDKIPPMAGG